MRAARVEISQTEATAPPSADLLAEMVGRTLQLATSLWEVYEPMNEMRKASLLKVVLGNVVLDHTGITGFTLKPPFDALVKGVSSHSPDQLAKVIVDTAA